MMLDLPIDPDILRGRDYSIHIYRRGDEITVNLGIRMTLEPEQAFIQKAAAKKVAREAAAKRVAAGTTQPEKPLRETVRDIVTEAFNDCPKTLWNYRSLLSEVRAYGNGMDEAKESTLITYIYGAARRLQDAGLVREIVTPGRQPVKWQTNVSALQELHG